MDELADSSLLAHFAELDDPRVEPTKKHKLIDIIAIATCGVICGADNWVEIAYIGEVITYTCRTCGSENIVKNGTNKCRNAQYHCKDCGAYRVLQPQERYNERAKATILKAGQERISLRGLQRVFGVHRQTVSRWLVAQAQALPLLAETLLPVQADDVLELDEVWTFVGNKHEGERWLWTAHPPTRCLFHRRA